MPANDSTQEKCEPKPIVDIVFIQVAVIFQTIVLVALIVGLIHNLQSWRNVGELLRDGPYRETEV